MFLANQIAVRIVASIAETIAAAKYHAGEIPWPIPGKSSNTIAMSISASIAIVVFLNVFSSLKPELYILILDLYQTVSHCKPERGGIPEQPSRDLLDLLPEFLNCICALIFVAASARARHVICRVFSAKPQRDYMVYLHIRKVYLLAAVGTSAAGLIIYLGSLFFCDLLSSFQCSHLLFLI